MYSKQLELALVAAKAARKVVMEIYNANSAVVEIKDDDSPVTQADKAADTLIREILHGQYPEYGMLTEESSEDFGRLEKDYVWIVDPIDGTKDFIARDGEFTINIALSYRHEIVVGVISIPALDTIYYASKGQGSYRIKDGKTARINTSNKVDNLIALVSHFHQTDKDVEYLDSHKDIITKIVKCGSSLKACRIAEGSADFNIKIGSGTKEWDIAASDIIVNEAGGIFAKPNGEKIHYNREDVYNREGFIITNKLQTNLFINSLQNKSRKI